MPSPRIQRRIDALLDDAEAALATHDWAAVERNARSVLNLEPENEDAQTFLAAAGRETARVSGIGSHASGRPSPASAPALPASFVAGRYTVRRFLGEGARKRVYLAHDSRLDREVAFCAIRTDGLDLVGHERVRREAQAMGRLGGHPNLVPIHDIGDDNGTPYIVEEFMSGGDVAGLLEIAEEHRLAVERTLAIAKDVCGGLAFIHSGGLVHRDLKPGNVFLAADGTAKIGDFGLAVALDRSRLTQHGLMLGTVAYMPPEQALGGETTPKADLYSLGAMLYEMVTGKPPFVGDDPTAVISQHINTPPVAPSWATEHCPPSLEELILRLLGKAPADRPKSAQEVLAALERVDPTQKSATHSGSNELSRVARGVFVGRGPELEKLRTAFEEAFAGRGNLLMLVGEPGIGKTRAAQELETYARMRGATVLWGRAHESSGAPAYWPWIQAGRQWASLNDLATIQLELEQTRGELVHLFPELRNRPGFVEPEPLIEPQSAQFRLFDAYVTLVRAMAGRAPLVIVLDDLHWSDKPTLLLLQYLARELANLRVLVVGTFRDTDLSRTHPLSETLAALNREAGFQRVVLKGLAKTEVAAYVREAANVVVQPALVERIYEETEGNPFFLSEVVNLLTQEGAFAKQSVSDIAVPDGVKEALGRRLDRISRETNELLQVCAVAGREFSYDTLTLLGDRDEDALLRNIEEALAARVIEEMEQPGRYRFTHALMQETLLGELSTTRRVRLHGQVGEALESRWGDRADDYASRLANHFVEAATLAPRFAKKAMHFARQAAEQAEAQTAWDEAISWYQRCLALLTGSGDDPLADKAELLTALGMAQRDAGLAAEHAASFSQAKAIYRTRDDGVGFARATAEEVSRGGQNAATTWATVSEALAMLGDQSPELEARLLAGSVRGDYSAAADQRASRAMELAEGRELPEVRAMLLAREGARHGIQHRLENGRTAFREAAREWAKVRRRGGALTVAYFLHASAHVSTLTGELDRALADLAEPLEAARRTHERFGEYVTLNSLHAIYRSRGEREPAEELLGAMTFNSLHLFTEASCAECLGDLNRAQATLEVIPVPAVNSQQGAEFLGAHARIALHHGEREVARGYFDECMAAIEQPEEIPYTRLYGIDQADDALVALATESQLRFVYDFLALGPDVRRAWLTIWGMDHIRGDIARKLELPDEAQAHYHTGLAWAERERCYLEAARCLQGLAEVAAERGEVTTALQFLDRAAAHLRPHGAKFYLDQVIARKVALQGLTAEDSRSSIVALNTALQSEHPDLRQQVAPDGTVTLLFSDVENSTPLNERLGDVKWLELLREHNAIVDTAVTAHHGFVVKTMGDGYMVAFKSAADGLRCAVAIQLAMTGHESIRVRIGLHTGEMLRKGDDFFGRHVNMAARVASAAVGGEVLVSDVVHALVQGGEFDLRDGGERSLKGFDALQRVWVLRWRN